MAEPLRNYFDERIPREIADQISRAWPSFDQAAFLDDVLEGFEPLGLMDRGRHIARALRRHLPEPYEEARAIVLRSVGDRPARREGDGGMASFLYLPYVQFFEEYGLEDFFGSMQALYILTQRFTGEFSVRPFIERYGTEALALLNEWTRDRNPHVRRLVSEGTRPRLPWASRLRRFQEDPAPVLSLLEHLRDDPEEFVRRSVANNLNDIGKDHPQLLLAVARRWMVDAGPERRSLIRHALRTLVKQGDADALGIVGYGEIAEVRIVDAMVEPAEVPIGGVVRTDFALQSTSPRMQRLLVDLRVHYAKANGSLSPRVFKLKTLELPADATASFSKRLRLADLTTRKHHPGRHRVEALVNGAVMPVGEFALQ